MIQPIRNNILVECLEGDSISEGGIFVPDAFKKESNKVRVVAVGTGTPAKPMKRKVGEICYRVKEWGDPIEENNRRFYLMDASAIIAIE
jgi:co-chaperonin GroES (HSP10)